MSKKQRLSPSASSRSSATPAPAIVPLAESHIPSSPSGDALGVPGPSRASASATPVPKEERTEARMGVIVPGSVDGGVGEECYMWSDLPMNKQGFRYAPCKPSPNVSPSEIFPFNRTIPGPSCCPPVHLSWLDRSYFLKLSSTATTATTDRGFRSARANVGVRQGTWYYEVVVGRGDGMTGGGSGTGGDHGNAHVRIGWGRREANLDAPVGTDGYGYAIRDVSGEKVHISRPKPYGKSFKSGDVIGCLISLPERQIDPETIKRKRTAIRYKGALYFEMDEYGVQKEMDALVDREGKVAAAAKAAAEAAKEDEKAKGKKKKRKEEEEGPVARDLPILPSSHIEFYLNGEPLGTAFEDLYDYLPLPPIPSLNAKKPDSILHDDGTLGYYPMISCFGRGKVQCNFGPDWRYPPRTPARPMSERYDEFRAEELPLDERDEARDAVRLQKEMEELEKKRAAAEIKWAATQKKKAALKKKRKGTETSMSTPGPEDVKSEVGSVVFSRAGTEEAVKKEEEVKGEDEGDVIVAVIEDYADPEEGVQWD